MSCGASSCQPGELASAVVLICAWIERMVTNTLLKVPEGAAVPPAGTAAVPAVGAAQEGGSLTDTFIVPMPGVTVPGVTMEVFPPPQLMATAVTPTKNTMATRSDRLFFRLAYIPVFTTTP